MKNVILRLAWRNLWRRWRRTWLTMGAMVFSNALLIFAVSLQFGSYSMMIDNTLQAFSGHLQLQHPQRLDIGPGWRSPPLLPGSLVCR